ncbi:MAG TPA: CHAT domain-containing protein, partial [Kineosporiaceae bacterium]
PAVAVAGDGRRVQRSGPTGARSPGVPARGGPGADRLIVARLFAGGGTSRLWVELRAGPRVADGPIRLLVPALIETYRDVVSAYRSSPPAYRARLHAPQRLRAIGQALFEEVLGQGMVGQLYRQARRDHDAAGVATHLVLEFRDTPHLLALPWEAMWDPVEYAHVALRHGLSRVIHRADSSPYLTRRMPDSLRVLGIVAQPEYGYAVLDVAAERRALDATFARRDVRRRARLAWAGETTFVGLQEHLRTRWDVVHFIGHGEFDSGAAPDAAPDVDPDAAPDVDPAEPPVPGTGQGQLVLVSAHGDPEPVSAVAFGLLFPTPAAMPRLVVLNACESATIDAGDVFSSTAGVLVQRGADAVVAMQRPIEDRAAIRFAEHFYRALAAGLPVEEAVHAGRVGLYGQDETGLGWLAPVIYVGRADVDRALLPVRSRGNTAGIREWLRRQARAVAAGVRRRRPGQLAFVAVPTLAALVASLLLLRPGPGGGAPAVVASAACPATDTATTSGTALFADTDNPRDPFSEDCYGFIDSLGAGSSFVFGRDPDIAPLERDLLADNPVTADGETLVWFGGISCQHYAPGHPERCLNPSDRRYDAEHDELAALLLFKTWWARQRQSNPALPGLHLVLANAGPDVAHADRVAQALLAHRRAFNHRMAVIGGGDSRVSTQQAIQHLVRAGIPMIAPTLSADHGEPASPGAANDNLSAYAQLGPFVSDPGYLALSPQDGQYAKLLVQGLLAQYPNGVDVTLYTSTSTSSPPSADDFGDLFITSQIADLKQESEAVPTRPGDPTRRLVSLSLATPKQPLTTAVCRRPSGVPSLVIFSDRWDKFRAFAVQLTNLCKGGGGVPMVISPGSVGRVLAGDGERPALAAAGADWPLMYFSGGLQCDGLRRVERAEWSPSDPNRQSSYQAATLLELVRDTVRPAADPHPGTPVLGADCVKQQITPSVAQMWDAAVLGQQVLDQLPKGRDSTPHDLAGLTLAGHLSEGAVQVSAGRVAPGHPLIQVIVLCVRSLADLTEGRAEETCSNPPTDKRHRGLGLGALTAAMDQGPTDAPKDG